MREYLIFLKGFCWPVMSDNFYKSKNVFDFIQSRQSKNKQLITTHMSEIIRQVAIHSVTDLKSLAIKNQNFTLKNIPRFKSSFCVKKKSRNSVSSKIGNDAIKLGWLKGMIKNHDHSNKLECRFIFQCLTSLRVGNTFDLRRNTSVVEKKCKVCNFDECCLAPTADCFNHLFIKETKTTSVSIPAIPFALKCYQHLRSTNFTRVDEQKLYSAFLKNRFNTKTHQCRKFLPNLFIMYKKGFNTGGWSDSGNTMERFYLRKNSKFLLVHVALMNDS